MDKALLEEYVFKEQEKSKKLEEKYFDKNTKNKSISVVDFFPEYKKEHKPSISSYIYDTTIPIQLPFSRGLY